MYGQGNYAPQLGRGSHTPVPPFQQRPVTSPSPHFQQGPPTSQPFTIQQGSPSVTRHAGYSGPFQYQHAPPPPVQQAPPAQVQISGMPNAAQSYLLPPRPPQVHVSTVALHSYPTAQQNSQWTQNTHTPPPAPPLVPPSQGPYRPEMFRPSIYPPQPGSTPGTRQLPPPPPPPSTSSFFTPAPVRSFSHLNQDSQVFATGPNPPPPPPPPPPSSPPPIPPSPPPTSSSPLSFGALTCTALDTDRPQFSKLSSISVCSASEMMGSDCVDKVMATTKNLDDTHLSDDYKHVKGRTSAEVGSPVMEDLPSEENTELDLPPPPPKPEEENVLRKIEVLCRFIAKNGPGFEYMTRQKESANPEFGFLFGGEPGSEAAMAHEFFQWMKKKCLLQHRQSNSAFRPQDVGAPTLTNLMDADASHSPSVSDMEMEDDITQPDEIHRETAFVPEELDIKEQLGASQNDVKHSPAKDMVTTFSRWAEEEKAIGSTLFVHGKSLSEVDSSKMTSTGAAAFLENRYTGVSHASPHEATSQSIAPPASAGGAFEKSPGELIKGASPFRLLQDYASDDSSEDDDDKPSLEVVVPATVSPSNTACGTISHGGWQSDYKTDLGSKSLSTSEVALGMFSKSVVAGSLPSSPSNDWELFPESYGTAKEANVVSTGVVKAGEFVGRNNGFQESSEVAVSPEALPGKDVLDVVHDAAPEEGKPQYQKEDLQHAFTLPKVDEYGRLVREGASNSDSDDSHYSGKHGKRRRSRSRSPHDRRRRRWSPRRRKEKRSRSRSWSPKKRRSRSRSPSHRHGGESGGDKVRREKGRLPECFDFLRGRCHRGAFCRYMHHESDKSDVARHYRSKQQLTEFPSASRTSDYHEEVERMPPKTSVHEHDLPGSSIALLKDGSMGREQGVGRIAVSDRDDNMLVPDEGKSERSSETTAMVFESLEIIEERLEPTIRHPENERCQEREETVHALDPSSSSLINAGGVANSLGDSSHGTAPSTEDLVIQKSQGNAHIPVLQSADRQFQHVDDSSASDRSSIQTSMNFQNQIQMSEPDLKKNSPNTSSQGDRLELPCQPPSLSHDTSVLPPQLPEEIIQLPPPPPSLPQCTSAPPPQMPGETVRPSSNYPSVSPSNEGVLPHHAQVQMLQPHYAVPLNTWPLPLPPPMPVQRPFVNNFTAATSVQGLPPSQSQQNQLPPRNDFVSQTFMRPFPPEARHSQVGLFQHQPVAPSLHMEDLRSKPLSMDNTTSQTYGGVGPHGNDHFSSFPVPSLEHSAARRMQSFPGNSFPPNEFSAPSSQNHTYSLQQKPNYSLHRPSSDGLRIGDYGNINATTSQFASDFGRSQSSHLSNFGGSKISHHYNPYASTFDQPLGSKFSSNILKQGKDMPFANSYDASHIMSHVPIDGQTFGSVGSRHIISSPRTAQAAELPRSGSDQYDPLFDSLEPSSNSLKKFDQSQRLESTLRLSSSRNPLDIEENYKQKEGEAVAITTSIKSNDEYGETADAEVGDVENGSSSNPLDGGHTAVGEVEIDQVKTPGKSKKSKDSRSMKLFKVALADYVKEVLKPHWRQGGMSKEAFKIIVKKTIDKVSGAMKSHHIPKSQAKINRYIDSSERKLNKLVMGYVDKYAKI